VGAVLLVAGSLAAAWRWTPLGELATPANLAHWIHAFAGYAWAPVAVVLAYPVANVILFPRTLLTLATVIAFGAWQGFGYAMTGILLAAGSAYLVGRRMHRDTVRRIAGPRLERVARALRRDGLLAVTAIRMVPMAPSVVEDLVAGAIRIRPMPFLAGTALGMLPGVLVATVFGREIAAGLSGAGGINWWLVVLAVLLMAAATWMVRRHYLRDEAAEPSGHGRCSTNADHSPAPEHRP